jgi:hypothetical protein
MSMRNMALHMKRDLIFSRSVASPSRVDATSCCRLVFSKISASTWASFIFCCSICAWMSSISCLSYEPHVAVRHELGLGGLRVSHRFPSKYFSSLHMKTQDPLEGMHAKSAPRHNIYMSNEHCPLRLREFSHQSLNKQGSAYKLQPLLRIRQLSIQVMLNNLPSLLPALKCLYLLLAVQ